MGRNFIPSIWAQFTQAFGRNLPKTLGSIYPSIGAKGEGVRPNESRDRPSVHT
ncbi:20814_t:CDS:2 [Gigaspora margarita]|uniref:20814_t:CDS:1 n=1 Tax=Gigaspora margarita TaxID=4874 RepID=A0ABN7V3J9_GIGMA|nr:20814_t:CDS:2 [Gigaspora margarita]